MLPFPEAAIDVDKPSDKALVEQILERGYPLAQETSAAQRSDASS